MGYARKEKYKTIDDEYAANKRQNVVFGLVLFAVIFVLQALLYIFFGIEPQCGPI